MLTAEGHSDWSNEIESNPDHTKCMLNWRELEEHVIDHQELTLFEAEKKRWRDVLERLITITLSLASRNLSFKGSSQCLYARQWKLLEGI